VQLTLSSGRHALALAEPGTLTPLLAGEDAFREEEFPGLFFAKIGLPSSDRTGEHLALLGTLRRGSGGVTAANESAIFQSADGGESWNSLAHTATPAPDLGGLVNFSKFLDPVVSSTDGRVAFIGRARGGTVKASNDDAIWWQPTVGAPLKVLAREGAHPPGAPTGARWASFTSLALPGGRVGGLAGPLFTARLAQGPGKITAADDLALYTTDAAGVVHEVLREKQPVNGRTIKTFSVLRAIGGSNGVTRSFNTRAVVVVQVTYTDNSTEIVKFDLP
jgi:hypothetical protein